MTKTKQNTLRLVESAVMIALATVLSILKLVDMPYGGSVTFASMLPLVIISYRHGVLFGLGSGLVYGVIQQLLGLENLSYVTGWQSVVALIIIDYLLAFVVVGFAGVFRDKVKNGVEKPQRQALEMTLGALLVGVLRYICHTVAGATVWAGLAIPTWSALVYSIGYNATYMIPETVVLMAVTYALCGAVDFTRAHPARFSRGVGGTGGKGSLAAILLWIGRLLLLFAVAFDFCMIFAHLQDGEDGSFTLAYLSEVNWLAVGIVSAVSVILAALLFIVSWKMRKPVSQRV